MAFANWLRIEYASATGHAEIAGRRIYILPTRYGIIYAVLLFLMLLGAVNYGNNPAHLLTFLLAGLGSNGIYLTWRNLRGLRLHCEGAAPVFAGEDAAFVIGIDADGRERPAVQLAFDDNPPTLIDVPRDSAVVARVGVGGLPRGLHPPGRLLVSTRYPLGLFRAWCYIECEQPILVYPSPGPAWHSPATGGGQAAGEVEGSGSEDFIGLRGYHPGDQPSRIDWKSYARDRGLNTRLFSGLAAAPLWIDWQHAPGNDLEARLSALCRAVVDAAAADRRYGLITPTLTIAPDSGGAHRQRCLRQLALYGTADA
jgi:uncharacterized protein (DUF58 family)